MIKHFENISFSLPNSPTLSTDLLYNEIKANTKRQLTPECTIQPFSSTRLNQWHTNEEIFKILNECNQLVTLASKNLFYKKLKEERFSSQTKQIPRNGSVFIFDRREVKNYKKDSFVWKKRKTGSSKSVREDRMSLKVNGIESIYGCYSHSYLMPTFHRRIYWLLGKPDIVLVHYLQIPNNESGECFITIGSDFELNKDQAATQLRSMIWPFYLNDNFAMDNLKLNSLVFNDLKSNDFISFICSKLFAAKTASNLSTFKIRFSNDFDKVPSDDSFKKEEDQENPVNKFSNHENFANNQGGERLMLVSEWKSLTNEQNETYQMIINEKILNLNQLNNHVLETVLPKFDNLNESAQHDTFIYIYENQQLFCEPIPFEIRSNITKKADVPNPEEIKYKNKLFLLERVLMLFKYYKLNKLEPDSAQYTVNSQTNSSILSFENRICKMIEMLTDHLSTNGLVLNDYSSAQFIFNNEHEGKTLVNLCIDSSFSSLFTCLQNLRIVTKIRKDIDLSLIRNELDLFTQDHHGINSLMLACQKGNESIGIEAFKWIENDLDGEISEQKKQLISSWIFSILKSKDEANKHNHIKLEIFLDDLLQKAQNKISGNLFDTSYSDLITDNDLRIIDNLDLSSLLDNNDQLCNLKDNQNSLENLIFDSKEQYSNQNYFTPIENELNSNNKYFTDIIKEHGSLDEFFDILNKPDSDLMQTTFISNQITEDHDKKIKALADNIIAAMPHRIKVNNYSNSFHKQNEHKKVHVLKRDVASFDNCFNVESMRDSNFNAENHSQSCYSSKCSSLSSSQSFKFSNNFNEIQTKDSSPECNENSNSSFHIDSPPSTAEFCQYFHANSSTRCSIETGFAELTLTDDEQRELYEAALIIQNAYRRYMERKKKKFKSDTSVLQLPKKLSPNVYFSSNEIEDVCNNGSKESSTNSLINSKEMFTTDIHLALDNNQQILPSCTINFVQRNVFESDTLIAANKSESEQQKQFEAASIIQKYYRRYKQYEKMQKYNEAASKIQKKYRAYKSLLSCYKKSKTVLSNFHFSSMDKTSIDDFKPIDKSDQYSFSDMPFNQKLISRKIVNIRQSSRFSPSSPASPSNLFSNQILNNINFPDFNFQFNDKNDLNRMNKPTFDQLIDSTIEHDEFLNIG